MGGVEGAVGGWCVVHACIIPRCQSVVKDQSNFSRSSVRAVRYASMTSSDSPSRSVRASSINPSIEQYA